MLDLRDFLHLSAVDDLFTQIARDPRGVIVVAGLGPRTTTSAGSSGSETPIAQSGRSTIAAIVMRHILEGERGRRAVIVGRNRSAVRVARPHRRSVEFVSASIESETDFSAALLRARHRDPELIVVERLTRANVSAVFEAAAQGICILTEIDTALAGGEVLQEIVTLGGSSDDTSLVSWAITVQRVPSLCPKCKQPHQPIESLVQAMARRHGIDPAAIFYAAPGCAECNGTGVLHELTAFDIFQAPQAASSFAMRVSAPSVLPLEGYLARLAEQGYVALEDAARIDASILQKVQHLLAAREATLDDTARALQRKLAEIEAANRVLTQRTEALIALHDVSQALSASTRLDEVAERVVHYARELCGADRAVLYLIDPPDEARVLALKGWPASNLGAVARLPASFLDPGDVDPVSGPPPAVAMVEPGHALRASLRVPLVVEEAVVGLLIVSSLSKAQFAPGQVALLRTFGSHAAVSIQRVRLIEALHESINQLKTAQDALIEQERIERELELARELQLRSLPDQFPDVEGVQFASAYRPAREVGGDLYDVIDLGEGRLGLLIADVSDKGLPAAFYMGLARSLILAEARRSQSPREVLSNVNRLLREVSRSGMFVTVFYGVFDLPTRRMAYSRAGHDRPLWLRADGDIRLLDAPGIVAGLLDADEFQVAEAAIDLSPGDTLILYTDGLTDALDPSGSLFGIDRWIDSVQACAGLSPTRLSETLFETVTAFQATAPQMDDMTLLVMRIS